MIMCPKCETLTTLDDVCPGCGIIPRNYKHKTLLPHQDRVVNERDELADKIHHLHRFIHTTDVIHELDTTEQQLLVSQLEVMMRYSQILTQRINKW